jgi:hypothetical protein
VYAKEPKTLQDLRHEIEIACAAIPLQTVQDVRHCVALRCQQCTDAGGLDISNISDIKESNTTID